MSTRLADYDYPLPEHLIARYPPVQRGDSRLLVVHRETQTWEDRQFSDIIDYLNPGDVLVLNRTKVIPARLIGKRATGGKMEVLLHQRLEGGDERWKVLMAPARKARVGDIIQFHDSARSESTQRPGNAPTSSLDVAGDKVWLQAEVESDLGEGEKIVRFDRTGREFWEALDQVGRIPLPPYLHREAEASDTERYQTVFADVPGAVAAPTAGLHFTPELLAKIQSKGIHIAHVLLHTGLGTFRPVESEDITRHRMHEEYYEVDQTNAALINNAKRAGKRCIAVGTTTVRTLETVAGASLSNPPEAARGEVRAASGMSGIFIYPPHEFTIPDAILTNFHLPKSTLLMMISAFAGREFTLKCYQHAIEAEYRIFSYGDAMLIL